MVIANRLAERGGRVTIGISDASSPHMTTGIC